MPTFVCPNCKSEDTELMDHRIGELGGVLYDLACAGCGHTWSFTV